MSVDLVNHAWLQFGFLSLPCFRLENVITSGRRKGKKEEKKKPYTYDMMMRGKGRYNFHV